MTFSEWMREYGRGVLLGMGGGSLVLTLGYVFSWWKWVEIIMLLVMTVTLVAIQAMIDKQREKIKRLRP